MRRVFVLVALLALVSVAQAEDHLCDDPARVALRQVRVRYVRSLDPTRLVVGAGETCTTLSKANTPGQWSAWQTASQAGLEKYQKVVSGLLADMTQGEKDAVDAALAAPALERAPYEAEVNTVGTCKFNTLDELNAAQATRKANRQALLDTAETNLRAAMQTLTFTTIGNAVTNIRAKLDELVVAQFNVHEGLLDEIYVVGIALGRCDLARSKIGR